MFGILTSAFNAALGFVFRQVIVKFIVLFAIYFVIQTFAAVLSNFIPNPSNLVGALSNIPAGIWFFLDLCAFSQGVPLVISAAVYRFLIRRIPVIG